MSGEARDPKHPPFDTVEAYVRHHRNAGHICCACFTHSDLPCCNPGHADAMETKKLAEQIIADQRPDGAR